MIKLYNKYYQLVTTMFRINLQFYIPTIYYVPINTITF